MSGTRRMMPSSDTTGTASNPCAAASRARTASAHGQCTRAPNGECSTTRQSPTSSRKRSTTNVVSLGTYPVASRCSAR